MSREATLFNDDYKNKFRTLYLEGKEVKEINEILGFNQSTFESYQYLNSQGLRDWYNDVKKEYFITKAEAFSKKLLNLDENDDGRIYALKQKEVEFLRETLGKDIYSKKTEIDNPQPITINVNSLANNKDIIPKAIDSKTALQGILSDMPTVKQLSGITTPVINNDVNVVDNKANELTS